MIVTTTSSSSCSLLSSSKLLTFWMLVVFFSSHCIIGAHGCIPIETIDDLAELVDMAEDNGGGTFNVCPFDIDPDLFCPPRTPFQIQNNNRPTIIVSTEVTLTCDGEHGEKCNLNCPNQEMIEVTSGKLTLDTVGQGTPRWVITGARIGGDVTRPNDFVPPMIRVSPFGTLIASRMTVRNYRGTTSGAVVSSGRSATIELNQVLFQNNIGLYGPALQVGPSTKVKLEGCLFRRNVAIKFGGAVLVNDGEFH